MKLNLPKLSEDKEPKFLDTGCYPFNLILGGGAPLGRIIEIYGYESKGKSTLGYSLIKKAVEAGGVGVLVDTERAASPKWFETIGLNPDDVYWAPPEIETIEDVFRLFEKEILPASKKEPDVPVAFVWDSLAATITKEEQKSHASGDPTKLATMARAMSEALRHAANKIRGSGVSFIILNQVRHGIGMMTQEADSTGGIALKFYADVRIKLRGGRPLQSTSYYKEGILAEAYITKNRIAPPFRSAWLPLYFDRGIDDVESWYHNIELHPRSKAENIMYTSGSYHYLKLGKWKPEVNDLKKSDGINFYPKEWKKKIVGGNEEEIKEIIRYLMEKSDV